MHTGGATTGVSSGHGAAKWAAVVVLSAAGGAGLTYSLLRGGESGPVGRPLEYEIVSPAVSASGPGGAGVVERAPAKVHAREAAASAMPMPVKASEVPAAGGVARRLDLNKATAAELELLPGVGPATAKRIVEYRLEHGAFASVDDLDKVKGIGPKTLERLRPLVTAGGR
jgi:competence protein ComEA